MSGRNLIIRYEDKTSQTPSLTSASGRNLQEVGVDSGSGVHVHFFHLETVELILDLLRQLWGQAIASSRLAPPVIHFRMEGVIDGALRRPIDVPFFDRRRGNRPVWLSSIRVLARHTSQNRSRCIQPRMVVREIQPVRKRFSVDVTFERREGLRKGIIGRGGSVAGTIQTIRTLRRNLGKRPRFSLIGIFG